MARLLGMKERGACRAKRAPVEGSHSRSVRSMHADASSSPSGLYASDMMGAWCPFRWSFSLLDETSHMRMLKS